MYQSKLYRLYQTLDKKALRVFKEWVDSPVHNKHEEVKQLFAFISNRKALNEKTLQKERAWKYLYQNKPYNDLRMRHVMSLAFGVLEEFVRYYWAKKDAFFQQKTLTKYLFEHKLTKDAHRTLQKTQQQLTTTTADEHYYYHQYELEVIKLEQITQQTRTNDLNITAVLDNARLFFMITTLRYAYTTLAQKSLRKVSDEEIPLLKQILEEIETNDYSEYPLLQVYYHSYYTLKEPKEVIHFELLKTYLHHELLSHKEKRFILLICINYAAKQINFGKLAYATEALELYQYGLESQTLFEEGKISPFAYKNIVTLALNLKQFDWTANFIEEYTSYLPDHLKYNYQHFNTAKLAFDKGDYQQAMELLTQVEYDELLLNIDAKVILLKIYYQQGYDDALEALLESFRVFLHRKKALQSYKKSYINLLYFVKKLRATILDKATKLALQEEIATTAKLAERKWLLEQMG